MKRFMKFLSLLTILAILVTPVSVFGGSAKGIPFHKVSGGIDTDMVLGSDRIRTSAQDYLLTIAEGLVPGHTLHSVEAHAPNIGTSDQVVWGVAPATQTDYVWPTVAAQVSMVSDDTTDNQAGVGARSILITGLLAGYVEDTETLAMHATDGTIAVTSVKSWLRINKIETVTAGSSGENAGNITISVGGNILDYMEEGSNISDTGIYTVPAGETFFIATIRGSGAGNKNVHVHVFTRPEGGLFKQAKHRTLQDSPFDMSVLVLAEKTDLMLIAHSDIAGGILDISAEGWLEED
jgi:hypothetical protein